MTDIQAALGRSQLKKIKAFQRQREKIAETYTENLGSLPLDLPQLTPGARCSWHLYPICVRDSEALRNRVMSQLHHAGVMANLHYLPVPRLKYYWSKKAGVSGLCPVASRFAARAISLPIYPSMNLSHQRHVLACLQSQLLAPKRKKRG